MPAPITCPHCSTQMNTTARFCPVCGIPRTHVRQELERASVSTGIPYERLLERAREHDAQSPRVAVNAPTTPDRSVPSTRVALIALGVLLAFGVVVGVGARLTDNPMPTVAAGPTRNDAQIATSIRSELSAFRDTSWHANMDSLAVAGTIVRVRTNLDDNATGEDSARSICIGVSGTVFRNDRAYWGIESVQVIGRGNATLVNRQSRSDSCDP